MAYRRSYRHRGSYVSRKHQYALAEAKVEDRWVRDRMSEWQKDHPMFRTPDQTSYFELSRIEKWRRVDRAMPWVWIAPPIAAFLLTPSSIWLRVGAAFLVFFIALGFHTYFTARLHKIPSYWHRDRLCKWREHPAHEEADLVDPEGFNEWDRLRNAKEEELRGWLAMQKQALAEHKEWLKWKRKEEAKKRERRAYMAIAKRGSNMTENDAREAGLFVEARGQGGWLYVVSGHYEGQSVVKVGISRRLESRLQAHRSSGLCKVDGLLYFRDYDDARTVESRWKRKFIAATGECVHYHPTETTFDTKIARDFIAKYVDVLPTYSKPPVKRKAKTSHVKSSTDVWQRSESPFGEKAA